MAENATIATLVSNVTATDLDIGPIFGVVTYAITSGNDDDMFTIRPTDGMVFVKRLLDRETTGSYSLVIQASDQDPVSPKSSTATLELTVTDINDNAPSCIPCIYGASINESVAIGTTVAQLNCSDADLSPNTISSYVITTGKDATILRNKLHEKPVFRQELSLLHDIKVSKLEAQKTNVNTCH